jgi:RES domain-containing protein
LSLAGILKPHPDFDAIAQRVRQLRPLAAPWQGTVFRSVRPKYWASEDFLSGEASKRHGGRWNAPSSFRVVYLSLSLDTALEEVKGWSRYYGLQPEAALPRVFAAIEADLSETLDLMDGAIRQRLQVSLERMTREDWRAANERGREALTQAIGRAAFEAEFEGLVVPSAQDPEGGNLLVFPDKLLDRSKLQELGAFE